MALRQPTLLVCTAILGGCVSMPRPLISGSPERWDAQLTTGGGGNRQFLVEIHNRGKGFAEFVIRRGERGKPLLSYETLHVSRLSQADLALFYDAILETLREFRFVGETYPDRMDGGHATIDLRIGTRSLSATFSSFGDTTELPRSAQRIMKFVDARIANHPKNQSQ